MWEHAQGTKKGTKTYEYNSDNKLIRGTNEKGEISEYTYNAMGVRVENKQTILNENMAYQTSDFKGSNNMDYMDFFKIGRATWQKTWKTNIGTIVQNPNPTVAKEYVPDYTTASKRDLMVYTLGESTARYVYGVNGERISAELEHAQGTKKGESGENIATDIATTLGKIYYRMSHAGSTLYATDEKGEVLYHTEYDPWGNPQGKTKVNINFSGIENFNNFTGYTYDETLGIYYAQARFYNPQVKRFISEDPIKDGLNWYAYVGNNPVNSVDPSGLMNYFTQSDDLLKGAVAGITDAIVGTAKSLVQLPSMVVEIVKGVAMGEINIIDLAKSLVTSAFSDYTYIIKNISVLSFASKSNSQVYNFGKAVGGVAVDVGLSFFGAKGVSMVQDLLKGTKAGQKIISLLNSSSKYFDELTCPKIIQKHINSSADDLLRSTDDVAKTGGNLGLKLSNSQSAKAWGTSAKGLNQGIVHFNEYSGPRASKIAKHLGLSDNYFSQTAGGFDNFTRAAQNIVKNPHRSEMVGSKGLYYVRSVHVAKEGVAVITYDGKLQSIMPSNERSFQNMVNKSILNRID